MTGHPSRVHVSCLENILFWRSYRKDSRTLELSISKKHAAWKVGTRSRQCRSKVPCRFAFPEIPEFVAFRNSGQFLQQFPGTFPEFSSGTCEQTPETATAFSSFLIRWGVLDPSVPRFLRTTLWRSGAAHGPLHPVVFFSKPCCPLFGHLT